MVVPAQLSNATEADPRVLAAVDLGSNSFHMVVARFDGRTIEVVDRLRETVRLAEGLDAKGQLGGAARDRALACLERFGERLRGLEPQAVRAVGTNTLRKAKNSRAFLRRAQRALGHRIEILPGAEEARLIYLGVAHDIADDDGRRLVIDIGGGSTEIVIGERFETLLAESLHMGCVSYTKRFFSDGKLTLRAFERAELAAAGEVLGVAKGFLKLGHVDLVGASGTSNAISSILAANGWTRGTITLAGLDRLVEALIEAARSDRLELPGLSADRRVVIAGGTAILRSIFRELSLSEMRCSSQALREGLMQDLLGRIRHEDVRETSMRRMQERYGVDAVHSERVAKTALALHAAAGVRDTAAFERSANFLSWAAGLFEIGLAVRHSGYHKHGAYLLQHSDLPGFSSDDQDLLALLVRSHRRKLDRALFKELSPLEPRGALRLATLLRLAVLLNRGRGTPKVPRIQVRYERSELELTFPKAWLDEHPLTRADLELERSLLTAVGVRLEFR